MRQNRFGAAFALALAFSMTAGLAAAERPLTAEEFEAEVEGRTLSFQVFGQPYGAEQYFPGRRVLWAFIGEPCQEGIWYPRDEMICFLYREPPEEQCWQFFLQPNGRLRAVFIGPEGPSTELYEAERSSAPLACPAPGLGV